MRENGNFKMIEKKVFGSGLGDRVCRVIRNTDKQTDKVTNLLAPPKGPRGCSKFFLILHTLSM